MIDPLGLLLTTIKADPAVAAIVGDRVRGGELADDDGPPAVVLRRLGVTRSPFGAGSDRVGLQGVTIAVLCFASSYPAVAALYGAVSDAVHLRRMVRGSGGRLILLALEESGGEAVLDPDTRWLTETCVVSVTAAAGAVA